MAALAAAPAMLAAVLKPGTTAPTLPTTLAIVPALSAKPMWPWLAANCGSTIRCSARAALCAASCCCCALVRGLLKWFITLSGLLGLSALLASAEWLDKTSLRPWTEKPPGSVTLTSTVLLRAPVQPAGGRGT